MARTLCYIRIDKMLVSRLKENKVHCYLATRLISQARLATRPEVEGVSLEIRKYLLEVAIKPLSSEFLWVLKKALPLREEPSIVNSTSPCRFFILARVTRIVAQ